MPSDLQPPRRPWPLAARLLAALLLLLGVLAIPLPPHAPPAAEEGARSFQWDRDSLWRALEADFVTARAHGCADSLAVRTEVAGLSDLLRDAGARPGGIPATDPVLDSIESRFFRLGPRVAACPQLAPRYVGLSSSIRELVKDRSADWDVNATPVRDRLYRTLYGARAAVEEVMLQHADPAYALLRGSDEPSATPSAVSNGVTLHSGDILVSRGGYPTSALIARGNDYPGNFSHIALVHIDASTRAVTVIEAHIELGVAVATADAYLADKKLRVMVLRPRADLPALQRDPMLPHRAAERMLQRARTEHIPYDFAMDYTDPARLFCSEVASAGYRAEGLVLWTGLSTISRPGLRRWLAAFGVRHFETQEPSDLEYDPQLHVVAEWRDPDALRQDHIDNAVTDVMLEGAERGQSLGFAWYTLPVARLVKGSSWVAQRLGARGTIPEGMSPSAALRNRGYGARHDAFAHLVETRAQAWEREQGYPPPYWVLVDLAREVVGR